MSAYPRRQTCSAPLRVENGHPQRRANPPEPSRTSHDCVKHTGVISTLPSPMLTAGRGGRFNVMANRAQTIPSLPGQVVLVFQGGGALGAYHGSAFILR